MRVWERPSELTRDPLNDPEHWRDRAEEARLRAEQLGDPEARRMMLEIAAGYERIAERAEQRLRDSGRLVRD